MTTELSVAAPRRRHRRPARPAAATQDAARAIRSLSERAYETLKWKILTMELESGRLYAERELCALCGLGRAPVAHAVLRLREDRLLDVIPRKGIIARSWSPETIHELMEARLPIETEIAGLAAERASDAEIAALDALLRETGRHIRDGNRAELARIDRNFHVGLARASRNEVMVHLIEHLHERSLIMWFANLSGRERFQSAYDQHRDILEALKRRDPKAARQAIRAHLEALRSNLPARRGAAERRFAGAAPERAASHSEGW
jgi:DNA-binding GntR family transcriptional regulator